nr:uncharacterized protein C16orf95 homolog isoform X3 [Oryctolagus cuniculus]
MVPCPHRRHGGAGGPAAWQREPLHLDSAEPGTVRALMTPAIPRGRVGREAGWGVPRPHRPARWKCFHSPGALSGVFPPRKSSLRTSGEEVCLSDRLMYPGAQNGLREPLCCECHAHFGGRLPVPRAEAALPYWVPSSLRPREQSQRTVRFHVPKASESCPCLCHCVRGRLPVPRSQAMMPYWVPQVLRSPKKTVKRQRSFRGLQVPSQSRGRYQLFLDHVPSPTLIQRANSCAVCPRDPFLRAGSWDPVISLQIRWLMGLILGPRLPGHSGERQLSGGLVNRYYNAEFKQLSPGLASSPCRDRTAI